MLLSEIFSTVYSRYHYAVIMTENHIPKYFVRTYEKIEDRGIVLSMDIAMRIRSFYALYPSLIFSYKYKDKYFFFGGKDTSRFIR